VKKIEASWFRDPKDGTSTRVGNVVVAVIFFTLAACIVVGGVTILRWILHAAA